MKVTNIEAGLLLGAALSILGCSASEESLSKSDVGQTSEALTPTQPFARPNIYDFSASQRATLANAIVAFIDEDVLAEHAAGHDWHHPDVGELFFIRHHDYLNQLESYLLGNGFSQFVPVPEWDPGDPIPSEFLILDPLVSGALNQNPNMPIPPQFADTKLCNFANASLLAQSLEDWHDDVHGSVGGAMGSISTAPGAPIFWLWHGLLDDTYHERTWRCHTAPAIFASIAFDL